MKIIHYLILIYVMYVVTYFSTVFQCQVLFLTIEVGGQVRFQISYKSKMEKKFLYILNICYEP